MCESSKWSLSFRFSQPNLYACNTCHTAQQCHVAIPWPQAVSHSLVTVDFQVQSQTSSCWICSGKSGTRTDFSLSTLIFPPFIHLNSITNNALKIYCHARCLQHFTKNFIPAQHLEFCIINFTFFK